jgi:glycosyltransferase involved in cell wall biosynthesis
MQKRPSIALAMIVRNEAHHLPELLKSIEGCFDEIHITDTGSEDDTVQVAEPLGCIVHHFEWCDDFAKARNFAFSHPKTDYIMWMDGDDVLSSRERFIAFRDEMLSEADMWLANYWYATNAQGQPTCVFTRERIIKNDGRFQWKYFIHEGIVAKPGLTKAPIVQFSPAWQIVHKRTEADLAGDRSRNLSIIEDKVKSG